METVSAETPFCIMELQQEIHVEDSFHKMYIELIKCVVTSQHGIIFAEECHTSCVCNLFSKLHKVCQFKIVFYLLFTFLIVVMAEEHEVTHK